MDYPRSSEIRRVMSLNIMKHTHITMLFREYIIFVLMNWAESIWILLRIVFTHAKMILWQENHAKQALIMF